MRIFGREPALTLGVVSAVLSLLATFQVDGLSSEQAGLVVAVVSAVFGAVTAAVTRPVAPAAFTAVVAAVAALLAGYGYDVPPETIAAVNAVILAGLSLLTRGQVSPAAPLPARASRGA
jgi:hypothetical protein